MSKDDAIRAVIENWGRAVSAGDRAAILAHHATNLVMFDFPGTVRGLDAYDRTWDFFFKSPRGPISFVPRDVAVTAGEDVAFASWVIVHEHHSVPTKEERFIDPDAA